MDITLQIRRFIHRIRYQLLWGVLSVTALVVYFTQFLPKEYTVSTSIYTGISSETGLEEGSSYQVNKIKSDFGNLISLTKSKNSMEKVALQLLAESLIYGDLREDNMYILARNYENLLRIVPDRVKKLVDKSSKAKTVANFESYYKPQPGNFLYEMLNSTHPHYSLHALDKIVLKRMDNSEVMEISYTSRDPGIALRTVKLVSEQLSDTYGTILFKGVNDVIAYFEEQLRVKSELLNRLENDLTVYNVDNGVINYLEQTKALAISYTNYVDRSEEVRRQYESSTRLVEILEKQMETRARMVRANSDFVALLDSLSDVNGKITQLEIFSINSANSDNSSQMAEYKAQLRSIEKRISDVSDDINSTQYSKEGIVIQTMSERWLNELIQSVKAKSELEVMREREAMFADNYKTFSPVGTQLNRREREIRVVEQSYLEILHGLNLARLKQKNIQLTSASLNVISEPTFPLRSNANKRWLMVIASILITSLFIVGFNLLRDAFDRSLRDRYQGKQIAGVDILGAFPGNRQLRYRGHIKSCYRKAAHYLCMCVNVLVKPDRSLLVNLISVDTREGKSFIARYLSEEWSLQGFQVEYLRAGSDFAVDNSIYYKAKNIRNLLVEPIRGDANVVLVEYRALQECSIPDALLQQADLNLVVVNAHREWKPSDEILLQQLTEHCGGAPLRLCLNNATRVAVEDFTRKLPPLK